MRAERAHVQRAEAKAVRRAIFGEDLKPLCVNHVHHGARPAVCRSCEVTMPPVLQAARLTCATRVGEPKFPFEGAQPQHVVRGAETAVQPPRDTFCVAVKSLKGACPSS